MRNTKNAFTLVELIVVITILAILGTIAFISLQGYSADARNSKRTSDIGNIQSAISLKMVEGVPLLSFINDTVSSLTLSIWGSTGVTTWTQYNAGNPNYTVLNVIAKDFKDPKSDKEYKIGGTTRAGGVFQVSATMEQDGIDTAIVNGTYAPRGVTSLHTGSWTIDGKVLTLIDSDANMFKVNDKLGTSWANVDKVSRDGVTLTLSSTWGVTAGAIVLAAAESDGLIKAFDTASGVTNLSTVNLPY